MSKSTEISFARTRLAAADARPLYWRIYDVVRSDVLAGKLRPGQRIASSRNLAKDLGVSRNTVVEAFDQLIAEGYVEARGAAGSFVARELPRELLAASSESSRLRPHFSRDPSELSRGAASAALLSELAPEARPFQSGVPALDQFPWKQWVRAVTSALNEVEIGALAFGEPRGDHNLRQLVASYLRSLRGLDVDAEQIFIVAGSQQALDLAARVLLDAHDCVWMEDPGYVGARAALAATGARLVPIRVDDDGLSVEDGLELAPEAKLVYSTPSHQYPLGSTLSLSRRLHLLDWAARTDAWIIEDDYDSEFSSTRRPLAPLASLDTKGRVIYVGTFSKTLAPALRLGYLVVPRSEIDTFLRTRWIMDRQGPLVEQFALADFIATGHFARHVRRMRMLYQKRFAALASAVAEFLPGRLELASGGSGLHVVGWLPRGVDEQRVSRAAANLGVTAAPLSSFSALEPSRSGLVLGFAGYDSSQIITGVQHLASACESVIDGCQ